MPVCTDGHTSDGTSLCSVLSMQIGVSSNCFAPSNLPSVYSLLWTLMWGDKIVNVDSDTFRFSELYSEF